MCVKIVWLLVAGSGKMDIGRSVWSKLKGKKKQNKKVIRNIMAEKEKKRKLHA
jgi:hypothetical protein